MTSFMGSDGYTYCASSKHSITRIKPSVSSESVSLFQCDYLARKQIEDHFDRNESTFKTSFDKKKPWEI